MEDGGVDTTVTDVQQHKMGQMADFSPLLTSSVFAHTDEFSKNSFISKICRPIIEIDIYVVSTSSPSMSRSEKPF